MFQKSGLVPDFFRPVMAADFYPIFLVKLPSLSLPPYSPATFVLQANLAGHGVFCLRA